MKPFGPGPLLFFMILLACAQCRADDYPQYPGLALEDSPGELKSEVGNLKLD